jgi:hypothetical protein
MILFIYLVPSDRNVREDFKEAIKNAALNIQSWYYKQLNSKTFTLSEPIVSVVKTNHLSEWYSIHGTSSDKHLWFWQNTIKDGYEFSGINPADKNKVVVFCIDADHDVGQYGAAGELGKAVLSRVHLLGLIGRNATNPCRWVGVLGHELGHALGLPHPENCETPMLKDYANEYRSLMYLGFHLYPYTYLLEEDKTILNKNQLINKTELNHNSCDCRILINFDGFSEKLFYHLIRFYKASPFNSSKV